METLLSNGIPFILAFQSLGEWLLMPMKALSFLGTENFYILSMPVLYWSIDSALGLRVGVTMLLSSGINTFFKFLFHAPRPYWINTKVKVFAAESSFGMPSGHAQNAVAVWGSFAAYFRKRWVWVISLLLIAGISLSRLYLAVHFPVDTVLGLLLGFLLLVGILDFWEPVANWAGEKSLSMQILIAFLGSVTLIFLAGVAAWAFKDWQMPLAWKQNAGRVGGEALHPFALGGIISSAATLFGMFAGLAWINTQGGFQASGNPMQRFLRYIVGMIGLVVFYLGLKLIFPAGENFIAYVFRYLRYALVGFWVSGGAPFIFFKSSLANPASV